MEKHSQDDREGEIWDWRSELSRALDLAACCDGKVREGEGRRTDEVSSPQLPAGDRGGHAVDEPFADDVAEHAAGAAVRDCYCYCCKHRAWVAGVGVAGVAGWTLPFFCLRGRFATGCVTGLARCCLLFPVFIASRGVRLMMSLMIRRVFLSLRFRRTSVIDISPQRKRPQVQRIDDVHRDPASRQPKNSTNTLQ